jgi:hypothetical protein
MATLCPKCRELPADAEVWPDPDCRTCKGLGAVGDMSRCTTEVSLCFGGAEGGVWSCTCPGGAAARAERLRVAQAENASRQIADELLVLLKERDRLIGYLLSDGGAIPGLLLAHSAVPGVMAEPVWTPPEGIADDGRFFEGYEMGWKAGQATARYRFSRRLSLLMAEALRATTPEPEPEPTRNPLPTPEPYTGGTKAPESRARPPILQSYATPERLRLREQLDLFGGR